MNKIIVVVVILVLVIIGVRACYLKDYVTVLSYPEENNEIVLSPDSITIRPFFYVEDASTLGAGVDFERVTDSLFIEDLKITVSSADHPHQIIHQDKVTTVIHPVTGDTGGELPTLDVNSFNNLSPYYKTIRNSGLPYNKIWFYFKTVSVGRSDFYNFKITGKLTYKGQAYHFEKDVKAERKVEYQPYRMMT